MLERGATEVKNEGCINRCLWMLLPLLLSACSTTFIPGLDRLIFSNSSAQVGPLVESDEDYPLLVDDTRREENLPPEAVESPKQQMEVNAETGIGSAEPDRMVADIEPLESREQGVVKSEPVADAPAVDAGKPESSVVANKKSGASVSPQEAATKEISEEIPIEYGAVKGKVYLTGKDGEQLSAAGTMVTLTPLTMRADENDKERQPGVHVIDMEDKIYTPRFSTIHAGDQVIFVNKDNIRHNVFSSSGKNAFDLGTYGAGLKRAVTLKEPGIVKIYCNIHSEMATFVAVGDQGFSARVDDDGEYQIAEVLPGPYELHVWNIRGESKRTVKILADQTLSVADSIDVTAFKIEPHQNKFGGDYSKNSVLFEDEFY